ncbi:MAG: DNA polymerase III subunit delta' [Pseudomonadota bacterium]
MTEELAQFGPIIGHACAKQTLLDAYGGDRMHHGWLFQGPRGVGKARLALQFAAHLLGAQATELDAPKDNHIAHLMLTGAHPDFRWITRPVDDKGKLKAEIPVDAARALAEFFALRPAMGGWRVAIVDAVDELNRFGANALLKTLEEPPKQALLILLAHGEQAVLPTLKSRCRQLRLDPLSNAEMLDALAMAGVSADAAADMAMLAPGRPGQALALQSSEARTAARAALDAANAGGRLDARGLNAAITSSAKSELAFEAAVASLMRWTQDRACGAETPLAAGAWADAHRRISETASEAKGLNMDKAQAVSSVLLTLQKTARNG